MQCLGVSGAVRPIYGTLGAKRLILSLLYCCFNYSNMFRPLSEAIISESDCRRELQTVAAI
jgi:hypothetical protein